MLFSTCILFVSLAVFLFLLIYSSANRLCHHYILAAHCNESCKSLHEDILQFLHEVLQYSILQMIYSEDNYTLSFAFNPLAWLVDSLQFQCPSFFILHEYLVRLFVPRLYAYQVESKFVGPFRKLDNKVGGIALGGHVLVDSARVKIQVCHFDHGFQLLRITIITKLARLTCGAQRFNCSLYRSVPAF